MVSLNPNPRQILETNIWLFALSVAFARRMDTSLVLHTDTDGEKLFRFMPYDEIHVSLDQISTSEYFWAAGKIEAQALEPSGSIHIDGDVFLKNPELTKILDFSGYDLLVQNVEKINPVYENHINLFKTFDKDFKPGNVPAFNCGVIGFNNQTLKQTYIDEYRNAVRSYSENAKFRQIAERNRKEFVPDLITEQLNLGRLLKAGSYKAKSVLSDATDIRTEATRIGFTHLLGHHKYELIEKVKQRLQETDPVLYKLAGKQTQKL